MQPADESKWEKICKEFHLDYETISHLKDIENQDGILAGFFEDLEQYLGLNSFSDLCSQFDTLKNSLDSTKGALSKATETIASLEASNKLLSHAKDDALNSLQLQIDEANYFREKSLATDTELINLKNKIQTLESNNFDLSLKLVKAESDKEMLQTKMKLNKSENSSLKYELRATKDVLGSYRAEKESDFQRFQNDYRAISAECLVAKSTNAEFQAKNKELYFNIDALKSKLKACEAASNQEIKHLKNELSMQTKLAENYRQLFTDSEEHKEFMKNEVARSSEDYEKLCVQMEVFRKEAISKHNFLLGELEALRLQLNQTNSSNNILDLSHSNQRVAMLDQASQIDRQLDELESDYRDISEVLKR